MPTRSKSQITTNDVVGRRLPRKRPPTHPGEMLFEEFVKEAPGSVLDELMRRHSPALQRHLAKYSGDWHLAEDAVQLTWLKVTRNRERFSKGRSFRPWLYTIATRSAGDLMRRSRRHKVLSLGSPVSSEDSFTLREVVSRDDETPAESAELEEVQRRVRGFAKRLSDAQRSVVKTVYFDGATYVEASHIHSLPLGTVKSRLPAAIKQLRNEMVLA